jgi:N-acetylneuraminate synthase
MTQFVAEFTTNHMGNFNLLREMVFAAKYAGANFIKMQKKHIESYYSEDKLNRFYLSPYGKTYKDYRKIFEFDREDFDRFDFICKATKIKWFTTVQDIPSLEFMLEYKLPKYKVASSSARDKEFLQELTKQVSKRSQLVVSVGGSNLFQIQELLDTLGDRKIVLQHCVAEYPASMKRLRLGNIQALKDNFETSKVKIGYSGHEEGIVPSVVVAKKYKPALLERHFCLSRHSFVHHIECSLEPDEFKQMIKESKDKTTEYNLPEEVFEERFGMSDTEYDFLEKQTYGNTYLGSTSDWKS